MSDKNQERVWSDKTILKTLPNPSGDGYEINIKNPEQKRARRFRLFEIIFKNIFHFEKKKVVIISVTAVQTHL